MFECGNCSVEVYWVRVLRITEQLSSYIGWKLVLKSIYHGLNTEDGTKFPPEGSTGFLS